MAFDPDLFADVLAEVSHSCLRGDAVPADLAALWRAQLDDDTDLLDAFELFLLDGVHDEELFAGFQESDGVEPAAAAAFRRMAEQICVVAEVLDGSLVGYWVGEEPRRPVAQSPIVLIDREGQFELCATTLAEAMLQWTEDDEPDDFAEVAAALRSLGCDVGVADHHAIWDRVAAFDEPNSLVLGYLVEERMRSTS
jgi:hypothetical protein